MNEQSSVPEPIDYLSTLGTDLQTAAGRTRMPARWMQPRAAVVSVSALVAVVVAVTFIVADHSAQSTDLASNSHHNRAYNQGPIQPVYGSSLSAISASGSNDVWAIGSTLQRAPHRFQRFALHYDGSSWTRVDVPHIRDDVAGLLAISPTDVWIVSQDPTEGAQHWDGTRWSHVALPFPNDPDFASIAAISGSGPNDIWLVGGQAGARLPDNSVGDHTLTMHWNGSRWSVVPSPNPAHRDDDLRGVVSLSPTDAWAVGSTPHGPLTFHWNGTRWSTVPVPMDGGYRVGSLWGVGTDGHGNMWAVGSVMGPSTGGSGNPAYLRWTSTGLQPVPAPPTSQREAVPDQISGSSPTDLWAVGCRCSSGYLLARYTGGSWRDLALPTPPGANQYSMSLSGVVDLSPTDAWLALTADRYHYGAPPSEETSIAVIDHWDGTSWRSAALPLPTGK